jgi:fused ribonucleaseE: endoribonuclease/RNA-binding protein/RNA degradosome binding protein
VTEALTAIDINSARSTRGGDIEETALNTNLEAADEIARQLRLRDLGGLVVIDFIDMTPVRHQREVENRIRDAVRQDRARIQISRISRFGLLEMSRQRLSPSLGESSHHVCPRCQGTGKVRDNESLSLSILRLIEEEALKENTKQVHTIVPVQIASYLLNEKRKAVSIIEKRHDVEIIVVPNEAMETPHFSVFRVREGEELNELSYNLAKFHEAQDEAFVPEESLVSRNIETAAVTSEQVMESAAVSLSIPTAAPAPVERKSEGPSLFAKIVAAIKGLFASGPKEEEKNQNNRNNRNGNRNNRRNQDRRNNRRSRNENNDNAKNTDEENTRPTRERVNNRRNRRNVNEEVIAESSVNLANVSDDNRQEEKAEKPVAERRQRRDLRKRVRIDDNANNTNENVIEAVEVPAIKNEEVENNAVDNTEDKPRQERQRRTPRHLRASNNQRRRRNEVKSPMPLFAAVASPELASGKVCIDYSAVNAPKENNFLSVDELLEQEKTKKGVITPATGIVVEEKSVEAQPALDFITQPANEAVQQKVQESLERLHHKSEPVAQVATTEVEPQEKAEFVRSYVFTGRAGTISAVPHTKAAMTLAKAPDEASKPFPIVEWTESRYYFNGKGAAGHHSAISHIYSEPTQAKAE